MNNQIAVTVGDIKGIGIQLLIELWLTKKSQNKFVLFCNLSFFKKYLKKNKISIQFNVINNTNPSANRGFLIHTFFGIGLWVLLAILLYFLNEFKYNITEINSIILSTMIIGFIAYFTAYYYGYLNF